MVIRIKNKQDIKYLFSDHTNKAKEIIKNTKEKLAKLYSIPSKKRTFNNTLRFFDQITADFKAHIKVLDILQYIHPDLKVRDTAKKLYSKLYDFSLKYFWQNNKLYNIIIDFNQNYSKLEKLNKEELKYIKKIISIYKHNGLDLSIDKQIQIKKLYQKIGSLISAFIKAIKEATIELKFSLFQLNGLTQDFIKNLKMDNQNNYIINLNKNNYLKILSNCTVESTRKIIWKAFNNRVYPQNHKRIKLIINLRQTLANLLGYSSYAQLDIENQMAKTPETVQKFLYKLLPFFNQKAEKEKAILTNNLPLNITLTKDNKIRPWDFDYILEKHKKNNINFSEYFPFKYLLESMLKLFGQFFDLEFKQEALQNMWDPTLILVQVFDKKTLIGNIILDLFARPHKNLTAFHTNIIPALKNKKNAPALSIITASLHKKLLTHSDVDTLFHEFGHAIHAITGATELSSFSGTRVATDFLEMPSQMLEKWTWDPIILKKISKHYKTGKQLTDQLINTIIENRYTNLGYSGQRQIMLSLFALLVHNNKNNNNPVNIDALFHELYSQTISYVADNKDNHYYTLFNHITYYGAKYYSYLWSQTLAVDVFQYIKQHGFLQSNIGKKYKNTVLALGASESPEDLLYNFLGRSPSIEPFFKYF